MMLRDDEEPRDGESGGVGGVDEAVEDVEDSESEAVKRRLGTDVGSEDEDEDEGENRIDVHGELEGGKMEASEEGEEAVDSAYFVEEEGERGEFGAGAEGH